MDCHGLPYLFSLGLATALVDPAGLEPRQEVAEADAGDFSLSKGDELDMAGCGNKAKVQPLACSNS